MATIQATNVLTGTTEGAKFNAAGSTTEIWSAATTTALASGDTINGPVIPANTYVEDVVVAWTDVDTNVSPSFAWEAGYSGTLGGFIKTGNTTGQSAGVAHADVPGAIGYTSTSNTTLLVTITATAATAAAGTCTIRVTYTASP